MSERPQCEHPLAQDPTGFKFVQTATARTKFAVFQPVVELALILSELSEF